MVESRMDTGFPAYSMLFEFGIMFGWQTQRSDSGGCAMRMLPDRLHFGEAYGAYRKIIVQGYYQFIPSLQHFAHSASGQ